MGIYLPNMEMPNLGYREIRIYPDGRVMEEDECGIDEVVGTAEQVPPHGRLIDADALMKELEIDDLDDRTGAALLMAVFLEVLKSAPTIIPAEPCNNLSKPCKEDEA